MPEVYPWISTLFVSEEYRGRRISETLIGFANAYTKEIGFERTYIPTGHIGLYEKYGYVIHQGYCELWRRYRPPLWQRVTMISLCRCGIKNPPYEIFIGRI